MTEQSIISVIAIILAALNAWGVFILSGINRKFDSIAAKLEQVMPREEINDRLKEHADFDDSRFKGERESRHYLANTTNTTLLNHENRLSILMERVDNLRRGRRLEDDEGT